MSSVAFNMSASMEKAVVGLGRDLCVVLGEKYGFDGEAAMLELGLSVTKGVKKVGEKAAKKTPTSVRVQPSIPLPFTGLIREDCCIGVKQNHGLYTQCFSACGETGLCKGCAKQASKNASGEPDCGLIAKRVMQGSEYRDSKGRAPVHYTKVMKKQKLTEEQVLAEAAKFGIEIEASHFAIPQAQQKRGRPKKATTSDTESETSESKGEKKTRGRPKKAAKVVEVSETEDLFASLMQQAQSASPRPSASLAAGGGAAEDVSDVSSDSESDSSESKGSKKKAKKSKEESEEQLAEKAAKFLAKEQEKEAKAAAKAAEKEAEKAKKLAEKEAEKAKKLAEKEQAQQEKALAQQKKLAEKEQAQQEKQKKAAEKAEKAQAPKKETEKKAKKAKKAEEPVKTQAKAEEPVADLESESESEDDEPVVTVKKFEYQGVTYLKSSDGILYHAKSQEVVGKWNEKTQTIDVYDGTSDSEEESDSDDE
jgi:hypothetical protein